MKHIHLIPTPPTYENGCRTINAIIVATLLLNNIDRAGWLKFGAGVGDHRIGYIDIDISSILCSDKDEIVWRHAQQLQIDNERCTSKYLTYVEKEFQKCRLLTKLNNIWKRTRYKTTTKMENLMVNIDRERQKIVLKAKKKCRSIKAGKVHYSPLEVKCHGQLVRLWSLVIKKKSGRTISTKLIKRKAKRLEYINACNFQRKTQ